MRNTYKLLLVIISLAFITSGVFAQIDNVKSKLQNQYEKKVKPETTGEKSFHYVNTLSSQSTANDETIVERIPVPVVWTPKEGYNNNPDGIESFCVPIYSTGCSVGDGFTDFAVEEIQNYGSGCENLNATGWSEYYDLGPAILVPGFIHTFTMGTGFSNQYVNIWIDFNDDEDLTPDEMILTDFWMQASGVLYDVEVTIPANATPGDHAMRAMAVYANPFTDPCGSYTWGEAEDYSVTIVAPVYGELEGYVTENTGGAAIEGALVSVNNGMFTDTTDANGHYYIGDILAGTWDATCTKDGYNPAMSPVTIEEGLLEVKDFALTAPTMDITPAAINITIDPNAQDTVYIDITNNGDGILYWNAELELLTDDPWIAITPVIDTVDPGNTGVMDVNFDATDIIPGTVKTANIHFFSDPNVGSVTVPVTMTVGNLDFGHIVGNVYLDGITPYNIGDVSEVLVEAGPYFANPDLNGDYDVTAYPGTYDVTATLYGYEMQTVEDVVLAEASTETVDFTMPCLYGMVSGTVTAVEGGGFIEGATVKIVDTDFETTTNASGYYEIIVEAGTYDVKVTASGFASQTANVVIDIQSNTTQDFVLETLDGIIVVIDLDPTPNPQITDVIQSFFPGGLVVYTTTIDGYPLNEEVLTVFLLLGIYSNEYNLTEPDAQIITAWIDGYADRSIYMEGSDTWAYDTPTSLHPYFNINGLADGTGDLANVEGLESYWSGFSWSYVGENNYIDHLEAISPAINVVQNPDVGYYCGVAYDEGTYRTVGASFEITGLDDGAGSFAMGVACVLGYFGYPVFTYGELEGYVTELATGDPVEGAEVAVGGLSSTTTDIDGYYYFPELLSGTWDVSCTKEGYNTLTSSVTIVEDVLEVLDFDLTSPILDISPGSISVTLQPNQQTNESLLISNTGNGPVDWTANLSLVTDNGDDIGDIVYELAVGNITGETQTFGSEWDGLYLWTTGGASFMDPNQLYQFNYDGNLVAQFDQPLDGSSSGIRDLAFDGTYLYGGNEIAFYQIDPADGSITELFDNNFGQTINALAWVPVFNAFYSKNLGSDLIVFDIDGNLLESISVSGASNVTGAAWDNINNKLWFFNQSGSPQSTFMEYDIVANELTGNTQQVPAIGGSSSQTSTGAFYATDMVPGFAVLGGTTQGSPNMAFAMDMGSSAAWINIDLQSGSLNPGEDVTMGVAIDATDLLPAVYEAEIDFTSDPNLGDITVPVQLTVEGLIPPVGLFAYFICTDVHLMWDIPGGTPDSYNIYRDDVLLTNVTSLTYTDMMVDPLIELCYTVTAVYGSEESQPTAASCLTVPLPEDLGIPFIEGWASGDTAYIVWDKPEACVEASDFNVYREDSGLLGSTVDTFYVDLNLASDFYEYYVTANYYFGESEVSESVFILIVSLDENRVEGLVISPNPAIDYVMVNSGIHVNTYTILDINGKVVESSIVESSSFTINVSQYNEGIYYLRFETDDKPILRKIILK